MTMTHSPEHPAASWGKVAVEALKHPYKTGIVDTVLGGSGMVIGALHADPFLVGLGTTIAGVWGVPRMLDHIKSMRHPTATLG
jgi:hypothetical protein